MTIKTCFYGTDTVSLNVTGIVAEQLKSRGYIIVSNLHFTDPVPGVVKNLTVTHDDGTVTKVVEGKTFCLPTVTLPSSRKIKCYYHIFCSKSTPTILEEQLQAIMSSPIYSNIDSVNCCVSGNDLGSFQAVLQRLQTLGQQHKQIKLLKAVFGDTSYERLTLNEIKNDPDLTADTYILYLHSKGASRRQDANITKWRKCMQHFLLKKADLCLSMFETYGYETVGPFLIRNHHAGYPDGHHCFMDAYGGNFWWARGSYLKKLFNEHTIGPRYYDTEQFLFKSRPHACNLYDFCYSLRPCNEVYYQHI